MVKRKYNDLTSTSNQETETEGEDLFGSNWEDDYKDLADLDEYESTIGTENTETDFVDNENEDFTQSEVYDYTNFDSRKEDTNFNTQITDFLKGKAKEIKKMCTENRESLYVSYLEIETSIPDMIHDLVKNTESFMHQANLVFNDVVYDMFPNYRYIKNQVFLRLLDVPITESIRSLRNIHLGTLVKVRGVVTKRSAVFPLLSVVTYFCQKCSTTFGPLVFDKESQKICLNCQSKGPFTVVNTETIYKDMQKVTIQEVPGTVPSGMLPRHKEIQLFYDLIDCCKPGEEIEVTGIYKNTYDNIKSAAIFRTVIDAITVEKKEDEVSFHADVKEIAKLSKHPNIKSILFNSFAPSVYGHKNVKKAVCLSLFGGERKEKNGHTIRGDINVLMLGDPGTAKSQILRYVETISHRAVLASGQGASSVGLTASVHRDTLTKEWTLEGGALVLADKGVCLIDEFDKMDDIDRVSIHEAMEQQSISISKAGIVASLHARCAVIAAANPRKGIYNSNLTFLQNVNLTDPIISRFDVLCVIRDNIGAEDEIMGNFIVDSHRKIMESGQKNIYDLKENENTNIDQHCNQINREKQTNLDNICKSDLKQSPKSNILVDKNGKEYISQDLLKKYILYARQNCHPTIKDVDIEKISRLYADLRKETMSTGSIPITARYIESIIRMSEAFAKMRLRDHVSSEDIDAAIEVALESFINLQKFSVTKALRKKFSKYVSTGLDALMYVLDEIFNDKIKAYVVCDRIAVAEFENRVFQVGLSLNKDFYLSDIFINSGYTFDNDMIIKSE
ncbi:hypothetical protein EDEG_02664 [Edhazardia aedis USNM 41457]|uniref:DNA replication licensing factor MCM2 n=1 Tax=Edhazardia aedis (strain USNM 41457) TaxID=1003232 RepID=J9DNI4_EDHAE|nr:hypothetical protein EDEG_02664 [Edhazardia aedis USNM 41457]|eukprot:EJW02952.1 hypothetical protein EDEG_02664 [Edhazardia aedis USNM 41457]